MTTDNGDVRHVNKEEWREEIGEGAMDEAEKELASAEVAQAKAAEVLAAAEKGEMDAARADSKNEDAAANVAKKKLVAAAKAAEAVAKGEMDAAKKKLVAAQGDAWQGDIDFDDKVKLETHLRDFKKAEAEEKKAADVAALVTEFYQKVGLDKSESDAVTASDWRKVFYGTSLIF